MDEGCTGSVLKDFANTLAGLGRALEVTNGTNLLGNSHTLLSRDGALAGLAQLLDNLGIVTKILLASNEDDRKVLAEVKHLGNPLLLDVVERVGRVDSEADEDNVRVRVRERTQTVVVFLTGGIPEGKLHMAAIDLDIGNVVLEDGGDVDLGEGTLFEDKRVNESDASARRSDGNQGTSKSKKSVAEIKNFGAMHHHVSSSRTSKLRQEISLPIDSVLSGNGFAEKQVGSDPKTGQI